MDKNQARCRGQSCWIFVKGRGGLGSSFEKGAIKIGQDEEINMRETCVINECISHWQAKGQFNYHYSPISSKVKAVQ